MQPGFRRWVQRKPDAPLNVAVTQITVRSSSGTARPVAQRNTRFFLGTVASHGIIEALRSRSPEFLFDSVPPGDCDVVLHTNRGTQLHAVTARDRAKLMRVCNKGWLEQDE